MGDPKGFLNIKRKESGYRPVEERIQDYVEVEQQMPEEDRRLQASRCMDCGIPFCHWACPVSNIMPEWQDKMFKGNWEEAYKILQETNNFPEITGRVCPAPCEASCVLAMDNESVTIRQNELAVVEKAFELGFVKPNPPEKRSGKKVAVIGSGPAGLACADLLNKWGHTVTLFESEDEVGGYLRFGIPDFKLDKSVIDRRVNILKEEGLEIRTNVEAGKDISAKDLQNDFDAICLTIGAREPRDLPVEGRDLNGIHYAMEYLDQQNRIVRGDKIPEDDLINAYNKNVVVIGGGDTGSDCVGSANRQGARSVTQLELLPEPPEHRTEEEPWPLWPKLMKTSSSHEEGCVRMWNISSRKFDGANGKVTKLHASKVEWEEANGKYAMNEVSGSEFEIEAELVLLAMGFVHTQHKGIIKDFNLELDGRGNIKVDGNNMSANQGIFAAGDSVIGASLVVKAIDDGRKAATAINKFLEKN